MYEAATSKREDQQTEVLGHIRLGHTRRDAAKLAGIELNTLNYWIRTYDDFAQELRRLERARIQKEKLSKLTIVDPTKPTPPKGDFTTWRRKYLGRGVEDHQVPLVTALEDRTNTRIICLLPPGSGKDTTAGDWLLYELCDDRTGKRTAWMMESDDFARRRLTRLQSYLTDRNVYSYAPLGPTSSIPTHNLIDDYGPFAWEPGMVYADGTKVNRPTWTQNKIYLLQATAPEADPSLWATGIGGATYGSRIGELILSDAFTIENQKSPMVRAEQMQFIKGTLRSRFDGRGRLVVIGTRTGPDSRCNYIELLKYFTGNSRIIRQEGAYHKYANGTAVIIHPAILYDENGIERSYWPEHFPLRTVITLPTGEWVEMQNLTDDEILEYADLPDAAIIEGLADIRDDDPEMFETIYQQNPPESISGEFTDQLLDHCDDPNRTIGVTNPGEELVLGVDPARTGGAAWVLLAVNREEETIAVVDWGYYEKLGITGIANKLIIDPITRYLPAALSYEVNHEQGVLFLAEVQTVIRDGGVYINEHRTGDNRHSGEASVASLALYMRTGRFRFPAQSLTDRAQMAKLKQQFKNWTGEPVSRRYRDKSAPDDGCMATWIGWVYARERLERRRGIFGHRQVPLSVRRRWKELTNRDKEPTRSTPETDIIKLYFGDE